MTAVSSVTAANTSGGDGTRATRVATRRIAACSRAIRSDSSAMADRPTTRLHRRYPVLKEPDESVWLPLRSIASTSQS